MGQKWIIDVNSDLRAFSDQNGMPLLAHQLDVTSTVALAEISSMLEGAARSANKNVNDTTPSAGGSRSVHGT